MNRIRQPGEAGSPSKAEQHRLPAPITAGTGVSGGTPGSAVPHSTGSLAVQETSNSSSALTEGCTIPDRPPKEPKTHVNIRSDMSAAHSHACVCLY